MNVCGDNKNQFKLFCIATYNTQEILSKEEASEFDSWPYPKETLWLLVADTFSCVIVESWHWFQSIICNFWSMFSGAPYLNLLEKM